MTTITLTDHIGETLTIPADANGATTATWGDPSSPDLTANAWYYPDDGVLFIPADCQGREDDTIDPETGEAIGQWVKATTGTDAVILDGAPRSWMPDGHTPARDIASAAYVVGPDEMTTYQTPEGTTILTLGDESLAIGDEYDDDGSHWGYTWSTYVELPETDEPQTGWLPGWEGPMSTDSSPSADEAATAIARWIEQVK